MTNEELAKELKKLAESMEVLNTRMGLHRNMISDLTNIVTNTNERIDIVRKHLGLKDFTPH